MFVDMLRGSHPLFRGVSRSDGVCVSIFNFQFSTFNFQFSTFNFQFLSSSYRFKNGSIDRVGSTLFMMIRRSSFNIIIVGAP